MTRRTPEEALNCVDSTVFAEVELAQLLDAPASAGCLPRHSQVDLRVLLVRAPVSTRSTPETPCSAPSSPAPTEQTSTGSPTATE